MHFVDNCVAPIDLLHHQCIGIEKNEWFFISSDTIHCVNLWKMKILLAPRMMLCALWYNPGSFDSRKRNFYIHCGLFRLHLVLIWKCSIAYRAAFQVCLNMCLAITVTLNRIKWWRNQNLTATTTTTHKKVTCIRNVTYEMQRNKLDSHIKKKVERDAIASCEMWNVTHKTSFWNENAYSDRCDLSRGTLNIKTLSEWTIKWRWREEKRLHTLFINKIKLI